MKIYTFNVNGIKSFNKHVHDTYKCNFNDFFKNYLKADIICLQEVRCTDREMLNHSSLKDYFVFYNLNKYKNGIYGVATFVRKTLYCRRHKYKVPYSDHGRSILTDHKTFKILNLYFPYYDESNTKNTGNVIKFYEDIYKFVSQFDDIIVLGDFNAVYSVFDHFMYYKEYLKVDKSLSRSEIEVIFRKYKSEVDGVKCLRDCTNIFSILVDGKPDFYDKLDVKGPIDECFLYNSLKYMRNIKLKITHKEREAQIADLVCYDMNLSEKHSSSMLELPYLFYDANTLLVFFYRTFQRRWLLNFLVCLDMVDCFRIFHGEYERYTCWNTFYKLRPSNDGSRIDYIFISKKFKSRLIYSDICEDIFGSDHCPLYISINLEIANDENNILKTKNSLLDFMVKRK